MRREKQEYRVTTEMIEGKSTKGKVLKDFGWINKMAQSRTSDRCTEVTRDRDAWKVMII